MTKNKSVISVSLLLLLSLLWGSSFLFTKILVEDLHPVSLIFIRCLFGLVMLAPILYFKRISIKRKLTFTFVSSLSLAAGIPWMLMAFSLVSLHSSVSGILNSFTSIFTFVLSLIFLKVKPLANQLVSLVLGMIALIILFLDTLQVDAFGFFSVGLMLTCTLCYATNSIIAGRFFQGISPFVLGFYTLLFGMIINGIPTIFIQPEVFLLLGSWDILIPVAILGFLSSGLGYVIFYQLIENGGPVYATFVTFLIPFVSVLLGVVVLNEPFRVYMIIGGVMIFFALVAMNWHSFTRRSIKVT